MLSTTVTAPVSRLPLEFISTAPAAPSALMMLRSPVAISLLPPLETVMPPSVVPMFCVRTALFALIVTLPFAVEIAWVVTLSPVDFRFTAPAPPVVIAFEARRVPLLVTVMLPLVEVAPLFSVTVPWSVLTLIAPDVVVRPAVATSPARLPVEPVILTAPAPVLTLPARLTLVPALAVKEPPFVVIVSAARLLMELPAFRVTFSLLCVEEMVLLFWNEMLPGAAFRGKVALPPAVLEMLLAITMLPLLSWKGNSAGSAVVRVTFVPKFSAKSIAMALTS